MAAPTDDDDAGALATMLGAAERGEVVATPELFAALYRELHRVARRQLHFNNAGGLTLGATTLLHEAYLDLSGRGLAFPDENRFFASATDSATKVSSVVRWNWPPRLIARRSRT